MSTPPIATPAKPVTLGTASVSRPGAKTKVANARPEKADAAPVPEPPLADDIKALLALTGYTATWVPTLRAWRVEKPNQQHYLINPVGVKTFDDWRAMLHAIMTTNGDAESIDKLPKQRTS